MAAARLTIVSNRLPVTVSTRGGRTRVTPPPAASRPAFVMNVACGVAVLKTADVFDGDEFLQHGGGTVLQQMPIAWTRERVPARLK